MNKIININLAGRLIPIDESAYEQLRDYLNRLKAFFAHEEGGDEIVHDMEDRMGELFQDKLKRGAACIMAEDVISMIGIMGSPEQIENETADQEPAKPNGHTTREQTTTAATGSKHLARSGKDKVIGGVCGGLAAYFNIDPIIIRIAVVLISLAWGAGIIVYLLLWALLPQSNDQSAITRRRLYRNPNQKVIGGVCSGIAAYANIDPIIPRVIFAAPLLGMIFFGIINDGIFFFPVLVGGFPTLVLLYIVLWASLPKATTLAEKLEMRGEKVDVHNLSQAIKNAETEKADPPQRSGFAQVLIVMVKIAVFFILGVVLLSIAGIMIAVIAALFGATASSAFIYPFSEWVIGGATERTVLWISIVLTLAIPFIAILRLLVRVISGRKAAGNKWLNITMIVLFIAGIFGLTWIGTSVASDFKAGYRKTYPLAMTQPANDTLIIAGTTIHEDGGIEMSDEIWDDHDGFRIFNDSTVAIQNTSLRITKSPDSLYHLFVQKGARGTDIKKAQERAQVLELNYKQEGNIIYLPQDFILHKRDLIRHQRLRVEIQVPVGKVFKTEDIEDSYYSDRSFTIGGSRIRYRNNHHDHHFWNDGEYYKMGIDGPVGIRDDEDEKEDNDWGKNIRDTNK